MKWKQALKDNWVQIATLPAIVMAGISFYEGMQQEDLKKQIYAMLLFVVAFQGWLAFRIQTRLSHVSQNQSWLFAQLKKLSPQPAEVVQTRWPWGAHHTELLGHLEAAARQFWVLYDPTDPSTAPTNEMVSEWLREQRGVSKDKAQAIASILRADGLKTGPRR